MGQLFDSFSFFDGLEMEPVTQVNWANYWRGIIPDGVVSKVGNEMRPYANSTGMYVYVEDGACVVDNHRGVNADMKIMAVDTADPTYDRIDLIVARTVYGNENESFMEIDILTGTPALDPVVPALTQVTGTVYEIPLAEVYVAAGVITLEASAVADRRNIFTAATQTVSFINGDTVQLERGMLVWLDTENEDTIVRCPKEKTPIGVVTSEAVAVGGRAQIATISGTIEEIRCTEAEVPLGAALVPADTPGLAASGAGYGAGIALESKASGAVGNVRSLLAILSKLPMLAPWYLPEGITEDMVIGAWQFVDRPTENDALVNINKGTSYALTKTNTVTWSANEGFYIPGTNNAGLNSSAIDSNYANIVSAGFGYRCDAAGSYAYGAGGILINSYRYLAILGRYQTNTYANAPTINGTLTNGTSRKSTAGRPPSEGVLSVTWAASVDETKLYVDGTSVAHAHYGDGTVVHYGGVTFGNLSSAATVTDFYFHAIALYNVTLSPAQHLILSNNIKALRTDQ